MYNFYEKIVNSPEQFRQLRCGESLITIFNCPLQKQLEDAWSHYNYIVYVMEGRKIWHTVDGSFDLQPPQCVFVRKGACIVEQFFDSRFCLIMFFIPDEFIVDVLMSKKNPIHYSARRHLPVIRINNSPATEAFFYSMMPYFEAGREPDTSLLQLKFRELVLAVADDPANTELLAYLGSLLKEPQQVSLQRIMEENFCFNLKLADYAKLTCRSLSAFKRDFIKIYSTTPGKWLLKKRLDHSMHLLTHLGKSVSDAAFESGFESAAHFSRCFREQFGEPPLARKQKMLP